LSRGNLGLIRRIKDSQQPISFDTGPIAGWRRLSTRFGPTGTLIELAARHGLTTANVGEAFRHDYAAARPRPVAPIILTPFKSYPGRNGIGQPQALTVDFEAPEVVRLVADVELGNLVLARHTFSGCAKPLLYRQFIGTLGLHGRWYASGPVSITHMPKRDRPAIQIDGQAVAEADVNASQLRILLASSGTPELAGDPYFLAGYERDAVKGLVTIMLGLGGPPRSITGDMLKGHPALRRVNCSALQADLLARFPCLENAAARLHVPKGCVAIRLQWLEARALTAALCDLWRADCAALPLHDCVIVPAHQIGRAENALRSAWEAETGARVVVKLTSLA